MNRSEQDLKADVDAALAEWEIRYRPATEWREWRECFSDLRRAVTAALPLLDDDKYWRAWEEPGKDRMPQAEEAVRHWLLDASPEDRVGLERLTRELLVSQIAVLAHYANLDRLTPAMRARVMAIAAPRF
jgi:hypothetical protein